VPANSAGPQKNMSDAGPVPKMSIGTKSEDTGEKRKELWGTATVREAALLCMSLLSLAQRGYDIWTRLGGWDLTIRLESCHPSGFHNAGT